MSKVSIQPATRSRFDDLQTVLGTRGRAAACQCQRAILPLRAWYDAPREVRKELLRSELAAARKVAPGLLAYFGKEPAGWCRLGPRSTFAPLRNSPVPWAGRDEDKDDDTVWAVVCFAVRVGYRRQRITHALAAAAVDFARSHGGRALEGYPMSSGGALVPWGELKVGTPRAFTAAGFAEVSHPSRRRHVVRIELR